MREDLVEVVLRVVEAIPPGSAATYGMIARAIGTGPRIVGRIMHEWAVGSVVACRERSRNFPNNCPRGWFISLGERGDASRF